MLRSLRDLEGYKASASDGDIGHVANFFLDDAQWKVRYLIVDTDGCLDGRRILISPGSFLTLDIAKRSFHLDLTRDKARRSPSVDVDKPVSRQHEREHYAYYGYPYYWVYPGLWGMGVYPCALTDDPVNDISPVDGTRKPLDAHLRSVNELRGYHIHGSDKQIGHVEDFIVDDQTWQVRYLVIDTGNWWFGKRVLLAPQWAKRVRWDDRSIDVDMSRDGIKNSPEWEPTSEVSRTYEADLHHHHGLPAYWDPPVKAVPARAPLPGELTR